MSNYHIEVENLTHHYQSRTALRSVDLKLKPGKITALIDPNGAGKSTLFRILAGQLLQSKGKTFSSQIKVYNCYNQYANERGQLSLDEFKTKLNQILDDAVHELKEARKKKKEDKEMTFCQEESKMWRQATAIGPPDKLETPTFSKGEACLAPTNQRKNQNQQTKTAKYSNPNPHKITQL